VSAAAAAALLLLMMMVMVKCKNARGCNDCAFFVYGVNNLCNGPIFLALIISKIWK
jgi:hypothetical protein